MITPTPTYSPICHTPATARTQLVPTRRYARYAEAHPVQPLKGLWEPRAASVSYRASVPAGHAGCEVATSYRALSPGGESLPCGIEENPSVTSALTANYSLLTANSSYTFSAKERDSETGLSYFGSRYYSSDLSIWLSVDPMSDKYASLSPYVYCANNPVKLVDPNGEEVWIPGLDAKGNVTYTAEEGDNYGTFISQFDCTDAGGNFKGREIFANAKLNVNAPSIKKGTIIKGSDVKNALGSKSEILKANWGNLKPHQKVAQLLFAVNHSRSQDKNFFDFSDYAIGFETYDSEQITNIYYPTPQGTVYIRNLSMWFTKSQTKSYNFYYYTQSFGDWLNKYDFRLPKVGSYRKMFLFTVDGKNSEAFEKLFRK